MNWALLVLTVLIRRCFSAYPQYEPQQQSTGYRGPPVVPVILPGGFIADTEEVARAKDLHFNAFAHAASSAKDPRYNSADGAEERYIQAAPASQQVYVPQRSYSQPQRQQDYNVPQQYTGPVARTTYTDAKPAVNYQQQPAYSSQPRYQGPPVIPVVLPNGYIAETADVEAAKEHHFQLVAQAQAAVARAQERANANKYNSYTPTYSQEDDGSQYEEPNQNYNQRYQPAPEAPTYNNIARKPYSGPPVVPVILPSGHIADTAEVAAAKISHLQQLLDAAQKSLPQQRYHSSR